MIKVCAYCRVSTEKEEQNTSLENQKKYFKEYISRNENWKLVNIYVDQGVTGTSTKGRLAFNQMMRDAKNNAFDLILTKEISRFARNTLDSILYTRKLKEIGIGVLFLNDNINTLDNDAELRLTIMSSIAQEESRKISERVKWGQKRQMEKGVVFGRAMLGYDVENGYMHVNEEGAQIVRLIFYKYIVENKSTYLIAKELEKAGVKTINGNKTWANATILKILKNEKYCGDLVQKKTYTPNYLNHKKKYNKGEEDFITIKDHHEPIIKREVFKEVQRKLLQKSSCNNQVNKYSNTYCLSGKIKCKICNSSYVARSRKRKDGSIKLSWKCYETVKNGAIGCNSSQILNDEIQTEIMKEFRNLNLKREFLVDYIIKKLRKILLKRNDIAYLQSEMQILDNKIKNLLNQYLNQEITKVNFLETMQKIEAEKEVLSSTDMSHENGLDEILNKAKSILFSVANGDEWNDNFYRDIIEQIICDGKNITVIFKVSE